MEFFESREDSSLRFHHRIHPQKDSLVAWLDGGFIGTPVKSLEFDLPTTGYFQTEQNPMELFTVKNDQLVFHRAKVPRSFFKYSQGTGNLLLLEAEHNQNVMDRWHIGLSYRRVKIQNIYYSDWPPSTLQRYSNLYNLGFTSRYYTKNLKYEVLASYVWNKSTNLSTGGALHPGSFADVSGRQKLYADSAKLGGAQNVFAHNAFQVVQFFRPGKRMIVVNDTLQVADSNYATIHSQWYHKFTASNSRTVFTDNAFKIEDYFYNRRLYDINTLDSIRTRTFSNTVGFIKNDKKGRLLLDAYVIHEAVKIFQRNAHQGLFQNVQVGASGALPVLPIHVQGEGQIAVLGYFAGDWNGKVYIGSNDSNFAWKVGLQTIRQRPSFNMQYFGSNYYYWHKRFNSTDYQSLFAQIKLPKVNTSLQAKTYQINNFAYFDKDAQPQQEVGGIQLLKLSLQTDGELGTHWIYAAQALYQLSSSSNLRLPLWSAKATFARQGHLFKKSMLARLGFDVYYNSEFKGYYYNPAIRNFTLSEQVLGGFPMIDVFMDAQVQTMTLFVALDHSTQGFFENDAFSTADYVLLSRSFRFGVVWRLFD
ncbi:MAG: hypothetical protein ACI8ZN_001958 [Bacteroidia bacterium]|jgi:hypothetical protein